MSIRKLIKYQWSLSRCAKLDLISPPPASEHKQRSWRRESVNDRKKYGKSEDIKSGARTTQTASEFCDLSGLHALSPEALGSLHDSTRTSSMEHWQFPLTLQGAGAGWKFQESSCSCLWAMSRVGLCISGMIFQHDGGTSGRIRKNAKISYLSLNVYKPFLF